MKKPIASNLIAPTQLRTGAWPFAAAPSSVCAPSDAGESVERSAGAVPERSSSLRVSLDANEINSLSAMLDAAYVRIQSAKERLEERVQQRTLELDATTRRLETILDTISDGLLAFDEGGLIESLNRAAIEIFGYDETTAIGRPVADLFNESVDLALHSGTKELWAKHCDGRSIRVELAVRHVETEGRLLHVATVRDLTEARYTRKILSEQAFLLEKSQSLIITLRPDRRIEWCNPCFETMTGYRFKELIDRDPFKFLFDTRTPAETIDTVANALLSGSPFDVELVLRHSSGRPFWVHLEAYPLHDEDGVIEKFVALGDDITDRKRDEQIKVDFVAMVSHELRTPLTVISGSLDALGYGIGGEIPDAARELVDMGRRNCAQLSTLIEDLLDVDKLEAGQVRFESSNINCVDLIDETLTTMQPLIEGAGLILETQYEASDAVVFADPSRLRQVIVNLLSNAIKFSPANTCIQVRVERHEGHVRLTVVDHGQGIPDEFRPKIFMKFSRDTGVQASGKEGFGLGLFICKGLIEQMGGRIDFESTEHVGSSFFVQLPEQRARPLPEFMPPDDAVAPTAGLVSA